MNFYSYIGRYTCTCYKSSRNGTEVVLLRWVASSHFYNSSCKLKLVWVNTMSLGTYSLQFLLEKASNLHTTYILCLGNQFRWKLFNYVHQGHNSIEIVSGIVFHDCKFPTCHRQQHRQRLELSYNIHGLAFRRGRQALVSPRVFDRNWPQ